MNKTVFKITLAVAIAAVSVNARAQKAYTEGVVNYAISAPMGSTETKVYFTADSSAAVTNNGAYTAKIVSDNKSTYVAVLVDVPMVSMKKAAVLTPAEITQVNGEVPVFTFTPTTETKQINGYNCKKVNAKEAKTGTNIDVWVTSDITIPVNSITKPFVGAGGVPVQFQTVQQGQTVTVELKSISAEKVAAGTFGVAPGYEKMSFTDLKALGGQ